MRCRCTQTRPCLRTHLTNNHVHCTMCTKCTLYCVRYTLYMVQCTIYIVLGEHAFLKVIVRIIAPCKCVNIRRIFYVIYCNKYNVSRIYIPLRRVLYDVLCTPNNIRSTLYDIHYILYSIRYMLYIVYHSLYSVYSIYVVSPCTKKRVHCIQYIYSALYTFYTM